MATTLNALPDVCNRKAPWSVCKSSETRNMAPDTVAARAPAKFRCASQDFKLKDDGGRAACAWRYHFTRGYPRDMVAQWQREEVERTAKTV